MLRILTITLSASFFTAVAVAQSSKIEAVPGFAVSAKGDTLHGQVNYLKKSGYRQSMQIKLADNTSKVCNARNYKYIKAGEQVFESFPVENGDVKDSQFFWKKSTGEIDLYEYQYEIFVANNTVTRSEFYVRARGAEELVRLTALNFKKKLSELVKNNPKTLEKVEAKQTKLENLEEIIDEHNKGV